MDTWIKRMLNKGKWKRPTPLNPLKGSKDDAQTTSDPRIRIS